MIKAILKGFMQRDGVHIMYATFAARILSFFASWIALKLIPNFELGYVIYSQNIIILLIPLSGFGATQALLRFGALAKTKGTQQKLYGYTLRKGIIFSSLIILTIGILSVLLPQKLQSVRLFLLILSLQLITLFLLDNLKTFYRVISQNKKYAQIELSFNLLLVILVFIGSYFLKEIGYVIALITTPLIIFLWFSNELKIPLIKNIPVNESLKQFWSYSFYAGLSNVASQLLIVLDILLIGSLIHNPEKITLYKYLSIIPFSLLFLPRVLLTTDFVILTKRDD
jgi:O-antigen/teichoic acid export membrane protein